LTPATIPKTPVHSLEPYISRTHMAVEISSYGAYDRETIKQIRKIT